MEQGDYLVRYLRRRGVPEVRKTRREYLSHYGLDQEYVYVLVSGVVKASVTLREGTRFNISYIQGPCPVSLLRYLSHYGLDQEYVYVLVSGVVKASVTLREGTRFNISYIQGPCPVSLLRDEVSSRAKSPYSVRAESREAAYMAVPRVAFWEYVNEDPQLLAYVKDYYRASLEEALYRMRYLTMNGKAGAAVPRVAFWEYVNEDPQLLAYVKDYYRASLEEALYRMRYLTMNGKAGAGSAGSCTT